MTKEKVVKKIHALLAISQSVGATEHEAASALSKSQFLLEKYQLTLEEVLLYHREQILFVEKVLFTKQRLQIWDKYILQLLLEFYHIEVMYQPTTYSYVLIGTQVHIDIAVAVYQYLKYMFVQLYRIYKKAHQRALAKYFYYGLYSGLYCQLDSQRVSQHTQALVLYQNAVSEYIAKEYGVIGEKNVDGQYNIGSLSAADRNAFIHGEMYAESIDLSVCNHHQSVLALSSENDVIMSSNSSI